jgi:tyrosyl-tRNA synthetase
MLERDDFQNRMKSGRPIGIHEFLYPLLQGYDSVALEADVELGGTDQKFNLLVGRDLQREYGQAPQVIVTLPLLEGTDGVHKMSKSLGNYVGIDEPPQESYGKIMSINDQLMIRYYDLLSDLSLKDVRQMERKLEEGSLNPRDAKAALAYEIVNRFHGQREAEQAKENFDRIFRHKELPGELPEFCVTWTKEKMWLPHVTTSVGVTRGTSEARRLIQQGAVWVNGKKITDAYSELTGDREYIIKIGKKRFFKVIPQGIKREKMKDKTPSEKRY